MINAPFTPEQCEKLNILQKCGEFHPFTCGSPNCRADLVATPEGWHCPQCNYTQNWAHNFMVSEKNEST
jgi:hypothetical protein